MANRHPSFPFYPGDYLSDQNVIMMTPEERGGYVHLLCHAWKNNETGSLPNDDRILAALSDLRDRWPACRDGVLRAFKITPTLVIQKRMANEASEYEAYLNRQKELGRKGAESRWKNRVNIGPPIESPSQKHGLSPSPSLSVTEAKAVTPLFGNSPSFGKQPSLGGNVADSRPRSPHQEIIDYYFQKFLDATGSKMLVNGKMGNLVKSLLRTFPDPERVKELIDAFFESDDDFIAAAGKDFGVFYSQVNKIVSRNGSRSDDFVELVRQQWRKKHGHS